MADGSKSDLWPRRSRDMASVVDKRDTRTRHTTSPSEDVPRPGDVFVYSLPERDKHHAEVWVNYRAQHEGDLLTVHVAAWSRERNVKCRRKHLHRLVESE